MGFTSTKIDNNEYMKSIDTVVNENLQKNKCNTETAVELCCEFAEFVDWHDFRKLPSWDKWRKITCNMEDYVELTNDEIFNLFLNSRNGN